MGTPPHPPMTDPMNSLTLLETIAPAGDFRAVWRAPSRAHTAPAGFPAPPLSRSRSSLPEAKPCEQTRSPGAAAAAAVCVILPMSGGPPLGSLNPGLAVDNDDGGGKGEGGNLLFRPIEGGEGGTKQWRWRKGGRRVRGS